MSKLMTLKTWLYSKGYTAFTEDQLLEVQARAMMSNGGFIPDSITHKEKGEVTISLAPYLLDSLEDQLCRLADQIEKGSQVRGIKLFALCPPKPNAARLEAPDAFLKNYEGYVTLIDFLKAHELFELMLGEGVSIARLQQALSKLDGCDRKELSKKQARRLHTKYMYLESFLEESLLD